MQYYKHLDAAISEINLALEIAKQEKERTAKVLETQSNAYAKEQDRVAKARINHLEKARYTIQCLVTGYKF